MLISGCDESDQVFTMHSILSIYVITEVGVDSRRVATSSHSMVLTQNRSLGQLQDILAIRMRRSSHWPCAIIIEKCIYKARSCMFNRKGLVDRTKLTFK